MNSGTVMSSIFIDVQQVVDSTDVTLMSRNENVIEEIIRLTLVNYFDTNGSFM